MNNLKLRKNKNMKNLWNAFKLNAWKILGALITDTKPDGRVAVSLGRVCFLGVLGFLFMLWFKSLHNVVEMPQGLMEVFYVLAGYVFGSKAVETVRSRIGGSSNADEPMDG
jgi:hypothetical protein